MAFTPDVQTAMQSRATAGMRSDLLTVVLPTRNRPHNLPGQLKLLETWQDPARIIVADSSDPEPAAAVSAAAQGRASYRTCAPELNLFAKLAEVVASVETPFVLLAPDRKITFPHAVDAALACLMRYEDRVAAQGYVVRFATEGADIDINRVVFFTPTIGENDPLQRHYHLMRRYQSWQFSLFRTAPLAAALRQARSVAGAMFQEVMFMNALAVQGKLERLPHILALETTEVSFHAPQRNNPLYWFLDDARSFVRHYLRYRNALARFIHGLGIAPPPGAELNQLLDTIHAVWLNFNFDNGVLNHAARLQLGDPIAPLPHPIRPTPWRDIAEGDLVGIGRGGRRYIWRREVIAATPREEISISTSEMRRVESQLDDYFSGAPT